ncbi:MAG: hypothetical protein V1902_00735 [Candidatus Falkowbacteria bacterium]
MTTDTTENVRRFVEEAVNTALAEVALDKEGIQKLLGNGGEFQARIVAAIRELSVGNQYADEEVVSAYGYLSGYKPKGLVEQTNMLRQLFAGIGFVNQELLVKIEKGEVALLTGAEGWFAIPNWLKNPQIFGATYSDAVNKVLATIKQARGGRFYNYREGVIDEKHLRQSVRTEKFFRELAKAQGDPDILIVAAQFGIQHRGKSVRRAREVFSCNEFGLGAFATGIMLLTHPERLQDCNDLWIDCAGDEFDPNSAGVWSCAPAFYFHGREVDFGADGLDAANVYYGSVSGFAAQ